MQVVLKFLGLGHRFNSIRSSNKKDTNNRRLARGKNEQVQNQMGGRGFGNEGQWADNDQQKEIEMRRQQIK